MDQQGTSAGKVRGCRQTASGAVFRSRRPVKAVRWSARQACGRQRCFGLRNTDFAEMKDRSRQHGAGMAFGDAPDQVIQGADAARSDHRHRHRIGDGAGERQVIAFLGAVAVHGGEQDFARPQRHRFLA